MKKKGIMVTILVCTVLIISAVLISCSKSSDKSDSDKSTDTSFSAGNASEDETATKGEADKATSGVADEVEYITGTVTEGIVPSGDALNEEPTGEPEVTPIPSIIEAEAELTPTPVATVTVVVTNTPTKAVVQKNTPTPTVTVQKNTPTPTPTKAVVQKNTPTPTPTLAPACEHLNSDVVYKKITTPEEGHWETKAAWDEPVYVRGYMCSCGMSELDFSEDGKTINETTIDLFMRHIIIKPCSYGVTNLLVDTIHHPESQVWVVDKQESYRLVADYFICYDCGYTESMDYLN